LREAFKLLSAEGVIEHDPHRGFFVARLSLDEARQLYRMRRLLEGELLGTVEWPSVEQVAALTDLVDDLERALREQNTAAWLACHRAFFTALFELSPQKILVREVLRLIGLTDRYRAMAPQVLPSAERKALQERHLLGALAKRNRQRLLELFERDRARIEAGVESVLRERGL
jgi:DNA-binding GntR family transcriptional regulator